jgi:hypothetical protein
LALHFLLTSDLLASLKLDTAPVGWQEMKTLLVRSEVYWGVTLTMSSDLTFWKEGAAYLRLIYEGGTDANGVVIPAQGIEGVVALSVFESDPNEFRTNEIYRGRVDFTTYRTSENGCQVKLKELGFATNLLNRAETDVDLLPSATSVSSLGGVALAPLTPTTVTLHSQMLRLKYEASQVANGDQSPGNMFGDEDDASREQLLYLGFDTQATNDLGVEPFGGGFVAGEAKDAVPVYTAKESGVFTIALAIYAKVEAHNTAGPKFESVDRQWHFRINGNAASATRLLPDFQGSDYDGDYVESVSIAPVSFTVTLKEGDSIYVYGDYYVHDVGGIGTGIRYRATLSCVLYPGSYLRITAESTTAPTPCRGLLVHDVLQRQVESMTDAPGGFYSEYYGRTDSQPAYVQDGPGALRLITNGFGLRGFPLPLDAMQPNADGTDPRKPLTANFNQVFNSLSALDCLGAGQELREGKPTLRVEPRAFFFQPTESLQLGAVKGLVKSPYLPLIYNAAEFGYQRWQSGAAVGLDEFNGQRRYTLPISAQKATYSQLSQLNGGGYLLEEARRQPYTAGTNKEGKADQDLFIIRLRRTDSQQLVTAKNEAFSLVTGILDADTAYNLEDSPARMLRRHGFWLRAGLAPQAAAGKQLLRGTTEGNDKLVSQLLTESLPVDEHADVPLSELASPLFVAETYEFTVKLRRHQVRQLARKPYGLISFLDSQGTRKRGYLLKMECAPASGQASFTLLRAPHS